MKKYVKSILGIALTATMLMPVGLTACGGGGGGGDAARTNITFKFASNAQNSAAWRDLIKAYNDGQGKEDGVYVVGDLTGSLTPSASFFKTGKSYAANVMTVSDTQDSGIQALAIDSDKQFAPNGLFLNLAPYAEADEDFKRTPSTPKRSTGGE